MLADQYDAIGPIAEVAEASQVHLEADSPAVAWSATRSGGSEYRTFNRANDRRTNYDHLSKRTKKAAY